MEPTTVVLEQDFMNMVMAFIFVALAVKGFGDGEGFK